MMDHQDRLKTPSPNKELKSINLKKGLSRSGSIRSKGIGLNLAVSPVGNDAITISSVGKSRSRSSTLQMVEESRNLPSIRDDSSISSSNSGNMALGGGNHNNNSIDEPSRGLKYDIALPSMKDMMNLELEQQLRLLALKEMSIVEIKDNINNLNQKLTQNEREVHKLRELIQKSLYQEIHAHHHDIRSNHRPPTTDKEPGVTDARDEANRPRLSEDKSIWSSLSKPLNLIQQFDTMLQNEFEKSLVYNPDKESERVKERDMDKEKHKKLQKISESATPDRRNSYDRYSLGSNSPLKDKSQNDHINLDALINDRPPTSIINDHDLPNQNHDKEPRPDKPSDKDQDMLQSVSSSIWSFVNDVKTNVMNSINDDYELYNLDNGSNITLDDNHVTQDHTVDIKKSV